MFSSGQRSDHQPLPAISLQMTGDLPAADQTAQRKARKKEKKKRKEKPDARHRAGHMILPLVSSCTEDMARAMKYSSTSVCSIGGESSNLFAYLHYFEQQGVFKMRGRSNLTSASKWSTKPRFSTLVDSLHLSDLWGISLSSSRMVWRLEMTGEWQRKATRPDR